METALIARLNKEFLQASSRTYVVQADTCDHLESEQKKAWSEILSSAATAEGEEESMVRPLQVFFEKMPDLKSYIDLHAQDEHRHAHMLRDYIQLTFKYVKKQRTFTDRVIYDFLFAKLKHWGAHRPLPFLATLYFYELYAEEFYSQLKAQSEKFKLPHLQSFFTTIQKDELRHIAGLKALIQVWKENQWPATKLDLLLTRFLMWVVQTDVNTSKWAFYNKKLKTNMQVLGLDPEFFYQEAHRQARVSYEKLRELHG